MKKHHSGFSVVELLYIIIIVGLIGFGGFYVWNSRQSKKISSPTTSSKSKQTTSTIEQQPTVSTTTTTYTNTKSGYMVNYPDQWQKQETNITEGLSNTITGYKVSFNSPDYRLSNGRFAVVMGGGNFVIIQTNTTASSISDYTANNSTNEGVTWPTGGSQTTVNGVSALRGTCNDASGPSICVSLVKDGKYMQISYYFNNQETTSTAKYLQEFNSFVESFKFQ